jgi:exodeoxyribonuclease VII small subunit
MRYVRSGQFLGGYAVANPAPEGGFRSDDLHGRRSAFRCGATGAKRRKPVPCPPMTQTTDMPASFEAALEELEDIVARMEGGQLALSDSLAAYQRGAQLLAFCQRELKGAQQQVEMLEKGVLKAFEAPSGNDA